MNIFFDNNKTGQQILPPPKILFFLVTTECNYRCKHCHMWMNVSPPNSLNIVEKENVVKQFAEFSPAGVIIFCGGELMLKEDEFLRLTKIAHEAKSRSIAFTNASLINENNYEKILKSGLSELCISIDGHIPEIHDFIRGVKGSFEHVTKTIKNLVELRKLYKLEDEITIMTNTTLFERNINQINEMLVLFKSLGVNGARFECLRHTTENRGKNSDPFYEKNFFNDKENAKRKINEFIEKHANDPFIKTPIDDWRWMEKYIDNTSFMSKKPVCGAFVQTLYIDETGYYQLCHKMDETFPNLNQLENFRNVSIKEFWNSEKAYNARLEMSSCLKNCGLIPGSRRNDLSSDDF